MSVGDVSVPHLAEVIELPVPREEREVSRARARAGRRWPAYALIVCGVALIPWLVVLAVALPAAENTPHWMAAWVGLDTMEAAGLIGTGVLTLRRHPLRVVAAAATSMLLVVDAWFDVSTSTGGDLVVALVMAATAELPLAAVCALLAVRAAAAGNRAAGAVPGAPATAGTPDTVPAARTATVSRLPAPVGTFSERGTAAPASDRTV
ncbi:hypothetical protein [Actinacidiphila rubida]|uniref:hypothetical protein n=1 Tax=Actinacidiphila rubida TaxID=310780 RepID=UPI000849A1EA|nr:hypothetical protein [Actinacidiphila rubida]